MKYLPHILITVIVFGGGVFFFWQYLTNKTPQALVKGYEATPPRVPPAFYTGGLEKGSGGQVSTTYTAYSKDLFAPSPAYTITKALFQVEAFSSPEVCGRCHVGIHENWSESMHAVSATDPWYLKVKDLLAFEQGEIEVRLCAGCHAPVALMTGEVGLYNRESISSKQGVSCLFCHTVESVHSGNGGYVSNPARVRAYRGGDYLSEEGIESAAHLVMASPAVHKEDMMRPLYSDSAFCLSCHNFELNGVKLQATYDEWYESSYADEGITCQNCHFTPKAGVTIPDKGHLVEHYPARPHIYRHTLGGGSTVVAPRNNLEDLKEAVELAANISDLLLTVTIYNRKAGHHLPTGVSDLRQMWLEIIAYDNSNNPVFTSGIIDKAGYLPENTVRFHQVLGDSNGNPLTRHDIWRVAQVLEDNRIPANGEYNITYTLPESAETVTVRLLWRDAPAEFVQRVLKRPSSSIAISELAVWKKDIGK